MKCKDCLFLGRFMEDSGISSGFKAYCFDVGSSNFGLGIGSNLWNIDWCRSNSAQNIGSPEKGVDVDYEAKEREEKLRDENDELRYSCEMIKTDLELKYALAKSELDKFYRIRCADCKFSDQLENVLECENPLVRGLCPTVSGDDKKRNPDQKGLLAMASEICNVSIVVGPDFGCLRFEPK